MDTLQHKFYDALGIPESLFGQGKLSPITLEQARRILSIKHISELTDKDYELIDKNTNAALAYYQHLNDVEGLDSPKTNSINTNVIELFPTKPFISAPVPSALAASSSEEDTQSDESIRQVPTQQQDVTLKFEFRTNPMTLDVTVRVRLSVEQATQKPTTIAWKATDDDRAIMQCQLPAGATESVSTRVFTQDQWNAIKGMAFEFGEINSD